MEVLYRGFDGLDVSFAGRIKPSFCDALAAAKERAQDSCSPAYLAWNDVHLEVAESGSRGGYAYRVSTGELGATWFFKKPKRSDPWGVRASCRSFNLATKGLGGARAELYETMEALGVTLSHEGESIGRVDYAIDLLLPDFVLVPDNFVMHSSSKRADHSECAEFRTNGKSGRVTSVTVGTMPGRQIIVYDKRAEVIAKRKPAWWHIWNTTRERDGLPSLDSTSAARSSVWRVEIRAGKSHLKDRWGVRTWVDLHDRFGEIASAALTAIRYAQPSGDTNRSRWPESELWATTRKQVTEDLREMNSAVPADLIKRVQLEAHDKLLPSQMVGLLTTRAAIRKVDSADLAAFAKLIGSELSDQIADDPPRFEQKLAKSRARYGLGF